MTKTDTNPVPAFTDRNTPYERSWHGIVHQALVELGGTSSLDRLYATLEQHPHTKSREHWKAKVRQVLQRSAEFVRVEAGVWSLADKHSQKVVAKFEAARRERYPVKADSKS